MFEAAKKRLAKLNKRGINMANPSDNNGSEILSPAPASVFLLTVDTTPASILHRLFCDPERPWPVSKLFITAVAFTFLPLLLAALFSPLSLISWTLPHKLSFFYDFNILFAFIVSFPCLFILSVTDQRVLSSALKSVQLDGTVTISEDAANSLSACWRRLFRIVNLCGQVIGIIVGAIVAFFNYTIYSPAEMGFWIAHDGRLLPVGYIFEYCIFLFYSLIPLYVFRNVAISLLLRDIVGHSQLRMLPLHPDKCGGLSPIGSLGLRNQYVLMIFGLNLVFFVMVSLLFLEIRPSLYNLIAAAAIAYLILGPLIFTAPLLPFRSGMIRNKTDLMRAVALRLRVELQRLHGQLNSGPISKDDEEIVDRLRKIGTIINELPVWPFDAATLRKFLTAYVIPILSSVAYPIGKTLLDFVKTHLL
jgi:hypothetical protein